MEIKIKNTPEQVELIKAMGSKNRIASAEAMEVFAAATGPVIQQALNTAGTASMIYSDWSFGEDESPTFPLDTLYDKGENWVQVWSQSVAGGLPSSLAEGVKDMKIATYELDSAVSFLKSYARKGRLDVVALYLERMAQEMLVKQERNAWAVLLKALADGSSKNGKYSTASGSVKHVIRTKNTAGLFQIADLNDVLLRNRRVNVSWSNNTPSENRGLTDMFVSPEVMADIRAFAYQPMNTRAVPNTDESTVLGLPDKVREDIYRSAGASEIFGKGIVEMVELGLSQKYNDLFDTLAGSTAYTDIDGSGSAVFAGATEEILLFADLSRKVFLRPVMTDAESGGQVVVLPDDQFVARQSKIGMFAKLEEARVVLASQALAGLII